MEGWDLTRAQINLHEKHLQEHANVNRGTKYTEKFSVRSLIAPIVLVFVAFGIGFAQMHSTLYLVFDFLHYAKYAIYAVLAHFIVKRAYRFYQRINN